MDGGTAMLNVLLPAKLLCYSPAPELHDPEEIVRIAEELLHTTGTYRRNK